MLRYQTPVGIRMLQTPLSPDKVTAPQAESKSL
jgi:hypothetical protein